MAKLIIENRSDLPMLDILNYARAVVVEGRISNNNTEYCYATHWSAYNLLCVSRKNKGSDRLLFMNSTDGEGNA